MSIGFGVADTAAQRKQSQYMESFLRLYTVQGCGLPSMAIKRRNIITASNHLPTNQHTFGTFGGLPFGGLSSR